MSATAPRQSAASAADPGASVWVRASAGTGKTHLLIQRVLRLLLADVRPAAIVCLTFAKAAAAEMAKRLADRLRDWATADAATLGRELDALLERPADDEDRRRARRLLAATLDAPGGLRIQTIHAFCESLLKRFPLEAGVAPHFAVADEQTSKALIAEAGEDLLAEAARDPALASALGVVATHGGEHGYREVLKEVTPHGKFAAMLRAAGGIEGAAARVRAALGVDSTETAAAAIAAFIAAAPLADLKRAALALEQGSKTDVERAGLVRAWASDPDRGERVESDWFPLFFTEKGMGPGKVLSNLATSKAQKADPGVAAIMLAEQARGGTLRDRLARITLAQSTAAVLRLGAALLARYAAAKEARALLDYDDLIARTGALLRRPGVGPWVLYKLDGGIDHILVDEAQDTAPEQWQVIAALADEFFAGLGARDGARTVFVVGDEKQSIFSFQGADLNSYAAMRERFARRVQDAGQSWRDLPLTLSRRSVPAVLGLVDQVFASATARDGVVGAGEVVAHQAARDLPGVVEIWPRLHKADAAIADAWEAPADYTAPHSPAATLAFRIASMVRYWLDRGEVLDATGRLIAPGDIMILVRRRKEFFEAMVRALKARLVPVAGADRLVLAEHIAAMDLVALGQFALLPDDDLNLATVLKGPLFGFDDDDLFALCWGRKQRLWRALKSRARENPRWTAAAAELERLIARADFVPPFEFYAEILGSGRGRRRILARLGPEAADPIDEFLNLALAHEQSEAPTLQSFLHWFARGEVEIKRDLEQETDAVRVMTVHAAKGRESAIVILPDTGPISLFRHDPKLLWGGAGRRDQPPLLWPVHGAKDVDAVAQARGAEHLARAQESRRLLYVALTRARDRLYVCGYVNRPPPDPEKVQADEGAGDASWYDLIGGAFSRLPAVEEAPLPWPDEVGNAAGATARRWRGPPVRGVVPPPLPPPLPATMPALPSWVDAAPPLDPTPPRPLSPSRPPGPEPALQSPLGGADSSGARRGRIVHRLLQVLPDLPVERRQAVMERYLAGADLRLAAAERAEIATQVAKLLAAPHLAAIFAPGALSEAPLVGRLGQHVVAGQMDRLLVGMREILVVDYKSGRAPVTGFHPAHVRQMALYRALLAQVYPGRAVRCALLWTETATVEDIPTEILENTVLV